MYPGDALSPSLEAGVADRLPCPPGAFLGTKDLNKQLFKLVWQVFNTEPSTQPRFRQYSQNVLALCRGCNVSTGLVWPGTQSHAHFRVPATALASSAAIN